MATHFTEAGLKFLRDLTKNNEREWFTPRKELFERELKAPMATLIGEINDAFLKFAPEHIRPPQKAALRIYRDIRFSANKAPYKTHVAAWWSRDGLEKTSGAGYYVSIGPKGVVVAAGSYMPDRLQLLAIRRHLVEHHAELSKLLASKKLRTAFPEFEGARLTRPPKGFHDASPEAMELILNRQWGISSTLPVETALSSGLLKAVVDRFKIAAPMIEILNAPLIAKPRRAMF
jgi:uncharacterized protein (TIGR02453 family)